jgi:UDPglucose 6-dehydrogenase
MNETQTTRFFGRILVSLYGTLSGKRIAVLGFSFKKDTGDCRETPALPIVKKLLAEKAHVAVFDPAVSEETILEMVLGDSKPNQVNNISIHPSEYEAAAGSHAIVICTDWDQFKYLDYHSILATMQRPAWIFDGRLILDSKHLRSIGFRVEVIGKQ